jgi:anti-sigma factor RsiW
MTVIAWIPWTKPWRRRRDYAICRQTLERVQEIVDGEIPHGHTARVLSKHLHACKRCGEEAEAMRTLKIAIARVCGECDPDAVAKLESLAQQLLEGRELEADP